MAIHPGMLTQSSSMGFDALHTVNGTLFVCQDDYCDPDEAPERSMNISFPALKQINGRTEFGGNIAKYLYQSSFLFLKALY